jgi:hypothetical protein
VASELSELLMRHVNTSGLSNKSIAARLDVDQTAVSKWLNDGNGISRINLAGLLDLLMPVPEPGRGQPHPDRARAEELWHEAHRARAGRSRRGTPGTAAPAAAPAESQPAIAWDVANPEPITKLAELKLFEPEQTNDGDYLLYGRLEFGLRDDENQEPPVRIGVKGAFVAVTATGRLLRDETLIGKRAVEDNLKAEPGGVQVLGPRGAAHCLEGEVFGGTHLGVLRPTSEPSDHVCVSVSVGRRDFVVVPLDDNGDSVAQPVDSEAKNAILNLLIYGDPRITRDELGQPVVQRATLRRRAPE